MSSLTIAEREYSGDYGMSLWGDYAVVKANAAAVAPDLVTAGYFDNNWRLDI